LRAFLFPFLQRVEIEGQKALLSASKGKISRKGQGVCTDRQERRCWVFSSDLVSELIIHIPVICRSVPHSSQANISSKKGRHDLWNPEDSPGKRRAGDLSLPLRFHFPLIPLYQPLVPILLRSLSRSIFRLGLELFSPFSLGIDDLSRSITIDRSLMIRMIIIIIIAVGDIFIVLDPFGSTPTSSFQPFLFPFSFFPGFFDGQCFSFFFQLSGSEETSFSFLYRWGGCSGSAGGFGWRFLEGGFRLS
jgi:hypothetical protein